MVGSIGAEEVHSGGDSVHDIHDHGSLQYVAGQAQPGSHNALLMLHVFLRQGGVFWSWIAAQAGSVKANTIMDWTKKHAAKTRYTVDISFSPSG